MAHYTIWFIFSVFLSKEMEQKARVHMFYYCCIWSTPWILQTNINKDIFYNLMYASAFRSHTLSGCYPLSWHLALFVCVVLLLQWVWWNLAPLTLRTFLLELCYCLCCCSSKPELSATFLFHICLIPTSRSSQALRHTDSRHAETWTGASAALFFFFFTLVVNIVPGCFHSASVHLDSGRGWTKQRKFMNEIL